MQCAVIPFYVLMCSRLLWDENYVSYEWSLCSKILKKSSFFNKKWTRVNKGSMIAYVTSPHFVQFKSVRRFEISCCHITFFQYPVWTRFAGIKQRIAVRKSGKFWDTQNIFPKVQLIALGTYRVGLESYKLWGH